MAESGVLRPIIDLRSSMLSVHFGTISTASSSQPSMMQPFSLHLMKDNQRHTLTSVRPFTLFSPFQR